jgi:SAM-dependent methyltransferase
MNLWVYLKSLLNTRGREAFILSLPLNARLLDVGCGNNSPRRLKILRPDIFYVGIDVQDYRQDSDSKAAADLYLLVDKNNFLGAIDSELGGSDGIISAHNLEHCERRDDVLASMCRALKPGGSLYLAFPCEASVGYPRRKGTLNYYDDPTHLYLPPNWHRVRNILHENKMLIEFEQEKHRPFILFILGLIIEPWSKWVRHVGPLGSTWALYGFESIIWARKSGADLSEPFEHPHL